MLPLFNFSIKTLLITVIIALTGCSSGGSSQSGLGLDLGGFWTGTLTERNTGRFAGTIDFGFQSKINELNGVATSPTIDGTFTYQNALTLDCPLGGINGILQGTVVGNQVLMNISEGDYAFAMSAVATNQRMTGDWNMTFTYTIQVEVEVEVEVEGEDATSDAAAATEDQEVTCGLSGTWQASKRS